MTLKHFFQLICFLWLIKPLAANKSLAKPGCDDTCGNVTIPYPFGIGPHCFLHEWYEVVCLDDRPYLRKYYEQEFGGEVLDVSLRYPNTVSINPKNSKMSVCENKGIWLAGNLSGGPFTYYDGNDVFFVGCGNVRLVGSQNTILGGCTSLCGRNRKFDACYGINCCRLPILPGILQNIHLNVTTKLRNINTSCGDVFFGSFPGRNSTYFSDPSEVLAPIVLRWAIPEWMRPDVKDDPNCYITSNYTGEYSCSCSSSCEEGNAYIPNGCKVRYDDPRCVPTSDSRKKLIMLVVGGTSFGILILGTVGFFSYKIISKRTERKLREKFFKKNGGLLLQQQLLVDENMVDKGKFFTSNELDKATDNFNQNRVLGHGGQGTVYKGMLVDGKIVAIKKSKLADENQVEQFINEVVVLSQINHRNVVKLLGCCLETEVPLLVYEFIPNGTLYDFIHNENDEVLMSWDMRLRIAIEVSEAFAYLHSSTYVPIYHRDIKSSNILLDEKHKAKVSDFGISRHVTIEQTHLTTMVKGTFGYLDPEYFQSNQFTDKSDVYSFGVVLIELLTRQKPILSGLSLATRFLISMEENRLNMILDAQILDTTNDKQVKAVAILAHRCLSLDGRKRPTMKEVALELESIKMSHSPSAVQKNLEGNRDTKKELGLFSDGISSLTTANDTIASSSDVYPLLSDTF